MVPVLTESLRTRGEASSRRFVGTLLTVLAAVLGLIILAAEVGIAAWRLGAGRARKEDPVQAAAGIRLHAKPGDPVTAGQPLLTLCTAAEPRIPRAQEALEDAVEVAAGSVGVPDLIHGRITADDL